MNELEREAALPEQARCWNTIGVSGDRSCARLTSATHCHNCETFSAAARALLDRAAPEGYLLEASRLIARGPSPAVVDCVSLVIFEVHDQLFAVDARAAVEVTEGRVVHRVPHRSGDVFAGVVNAHGQLELCASLAGLLRLERGRHHKGAARAGSQLLLVEHEGRRWALSMTLAHGVHRLSQAERREVPAGIAQDGTGFVQNLYSWRSRTVAHLDLDCVFTALEKALR